MITSYKTEVVSVFAQIKAKYGIETAYSHFINGHTLPYLAYIGAGSQTFSADNVIDWRINEYQVELYYKTKDPTLEENIENEFIAGGWHFDKSTDIYLDSEDMFYISYQLS